MAAGVSAPPPDPREIPGIRRMRERYDPWTGRAWLDIRAEGGRHRVPFGPGYAEIRRDLRKAWPDRPLDADWSDGVFPPAPGGRAFAPVLAVGFVVLALTVGALGVWHVSVAAIGVAIGGSWWLARQLDGLDANGVGIRVGPPWALRVPWHAVREVGIVREGRSTWVYVVTDRGTASTGTLPSALAPAARGRIRRLGGLVVAEGPSGALDLRYARWQAAATGIAWGVGLGTLAAAPFTPVPFAGIAAGGAVAAGLGLLAIAVHARATGWGTGAVGYLTLAYALVVALVSLALR